MSHTAAAERYAATEPRRVQAEDEERRRSAKGVQRTAYMPRAGYGHSGHNYYPCPNSRAGIICLAQYVGAICPMQPDGAAVPAPCPYMRSVLGRATVGAAYITACNYSTNMRVCASIRRLKPGSRSSDSISRSISGMAWRHWSIWRVISAGFSVMNDPNCDTFR